LLTVSKAPSASSPPPPSGTYNQTIGSAKQSVGTLIGNESLRRQGEEQNEKGKEEEAARQVRDWGEGVGQRVKGKAGEVYSSMKPEEPGQEGVDRLKYKQMHDEGKAKQEQTHEEIDRRWGDAPK
jgi:indoleamine 2,3-dioxygenase